MADGMAAALITGPAEQIAALFGWARTITRTITRGNPDTTDSRTVGERRVDALLHAILGSSTGVARIGRPPVALKLIMNATTVAGDDNEPGWLEGYGNLAAALARDLAMTPASLQALFISPATGQLMDLSPELRTPGARLGRFIRARDGMCSAPACGAHADRLELDHITPIIHGGKTVRLNLHPLCPRHHRSRHTGRWKVRRDPGGTEIWTDPHGNAYETQATDYRPPATARKPADERHRQPPGQPSSSPPSSSPPGSSPPGHYDPLDATAPPRPTEPDDEPPPRDEPCPF